jgi:uncharacterized membrane protein YfcA
MDLSSYIWLAVLALGAAVVNGAVGYGFSSIVTPIAILWVSNRLLNPALVVVELFVNVALLVRERKYIRSTWSHASPVIMTLLPGVLAGTAGLALLAVTDVKVVVYAALFPLVGLQLLGFSRPVRNARAAGAAIGPGIGFLYSLTTISGPPLALYFRNQGLTKDEFRATIAQVRVAESSLTLTTYGVFTFFFGSQLLTFPSLVLLPYLALPVLVGVPIGALLLTRVSADTFRKFVMNVDGLIVSYGLSQVLVAVNVVSRPSSYWVLAALASIVIALTAMAFARARRVEAPVPGVVEMEPPPEPD